MSEQALVEIPQYLRDYIDQQVAASLSKAYTPGFNLFAEDEALIPTYKNVGDSGFDLRANIASTVILQPGERTLIKTGLFIEMPVGFELQIRPRSGRALNEGLTVVNAPGTIDASYRGEIGVILLNTDKSNAIEIPRFERIAQGVVCRVERVNFNVVASRDQLTSTERGIGGFGSTGRN